MKRFWNWVKNEGDAPRRLYLNGIIAEESWFEDDVTPALFKADLDAGSGDIEVWINSPGGDVVAASQIYSMLMEYPANVTVKIDGMAASAASVIAMAGTTVLMAPTAIMMIHNPLTVAIGDSAEMRRAIHMLDEFKDAIMNAYEIKTGMSRTKISHLMDAETWLSANSAVEMGFADGMLYADSEKGAHAHALTNLVFSRRAVTNSLLDKLKRKSPPASAPGTPVADLDKRLALLH